MSHTRTKSLSLIWNTVNLFHFTHTHTHTHTALTTSLCSGLQFPAQLQSEITVYIVSVPSSSRIYRSVPEASEFNQTCFHEEKSGVFPIMHCVLWREEKHLQLLYDLTLMLHTQMIYTRGRWEETNCDFTLKLRRKLYTTTQWRSQSSLCVCVCVCVCLCVWSETDWLYSTLEERFCSGICDMLRHVICVELPGMRSTPVEASNTYPKFNLDSNSNIDVFSQSRVSCDKYHCPKS